jgi:hypothetical protein
MKLKNYRSTALFLLCLPVALLAQAEDQSTRAAPKSEAVAASSTNPAAPKLTLAIPDPDILKGGFVYLPFRVDNMTLLPMYVEINGEDVLKLKPKIGHLHVGVDDTAWQWIHALNDPIYFGPLLPGAHKVRVEIVDAAHGVIDVQTVHFVVPKN